jgi:hypothetical protein
MANKKEAFRRKSRVHDPMVAEMAKSVTQGLKNGFAVVLLGL